MVSLCKCLHLPPSNISMMKLKFQQSRSFVQARHILDASTRLRLMSWRIDALYKFDTKSFWNSYGGLKKNHMALLRLQSRY